MYRSASWNRVAEDYSVPWSAPKGLWKGLDEDEPAQYNPTGQEVTKKDKSRAKLAENAVHIIPFVLLACALVLWFFSNPDVDVGVKEESIAARIKGLTIEGDIDNDSDGTQTGFLGAATEFGVSDKTKLKRDVNKRHRRIQASRKFVKEMLKSVIPMPFYDIGEQQYPTLGYIVSKPGNAGAYDFDPPIPTIDDAIFGSDEFRMYAYKIIRCPRTRSHDWTECPYAHRGEKATRRDPRRYSYCAVACPAFRNGSCHRGDSCEFAHGVFEYWLHPARYRTRACNAGNLCQRKVCFFAHASEQLRQSEGKHRCRYSYRPVRTTSARGGNGDGIALRLDGEDYDTSRSPVKIGKSDLDSNEERVLLKCWSRMSIVDDHYEPSDLDLDLSHFAWISELVD